MAANISPVEMIDILKDNGDDPAMVRKLLQDNPTLLTTLANPVMLEKLWRENSILSASDPKQLLESGGSINGMILLHAVVILNKPQILKMLIQEYQIDTSTIYTNSHGDIFSAFDLASFLQHSAIMKILVTQSKANLSGNDLCRAVQSKEIETVRFLLEGISVDSRDDLGNTALCYALRNANPEIASLLLQAGADIHAAWYHEDCPELPLHYAVRENQIDMIHFLIAYGVQIDVENWHRKTPLDYALMSKNRKAAAILVNAGADIHKAINSSFYEKDKDWLAPLLKMRTLWDMWEKDNDRIAEVSNPIHTTFSANDEGKKEASRDLGNQYSFFVQWLPAECLQGTLSLLEQDEVSENARAEEAFRRGI